MTDRTERFPRPPDKRENARRIWADAPSKPGGLFTDQDSDNRRAMQDSARIDESLWRLGNALRLVRLSDWERDFARSLLGQAKRGGRRWHFSEKQLATVRRILAGLSEPDAGPLIDDGGDDAAA